MGIEFELFMSRFLLVFLLDIFYLLCDENTSLFNALPISWILSAFTITAENPVITSAWAQFLVALWLSYPYTFTWGSLRLLSDVI